MAAQHRNGTPLSCARSAFQIRPDLVADIAPGSTRSFRDGEINHAVCIRWPPVLSGITVCGTRDGRVPTPSVKRLIARPGLVDPDVNGEAAIVRQINRAVAVPQSTVARPAGVAMGQDVDGSPGFLVAAIA